MSIVPERPNVPQQPSALLSDLQSEVAVEAAPLLQLIVRYVWVIVTVLVVLILALAGTAGYQWYARHSHQSAHGDLQKVMQSAQGEERLEALEKFLPEAPDSVKTAILLAIADTAAQLGKFDVAADAYGRVSAQDPEGAAGVMAVLNQGQLLMHAGKAAQAVSVLEKIENTVPEAQRPLVRQILAEAAVLAGNLPRAREVFSALIAAAKGADKLYYEYRLATLDAAPPAGAAPAPQTPAP